MANLVLGVRRIDFTGDDGRRVQMVKVSYVGSPESSEDVRGCLPMTVTSRNMDLFDVFRSVPGHYELNFEMRPDSKGRPMTVLTGGRLVGDADLDVVKKVK